MVAGRTNYTLKITGLTNGNMADLTTGYIDGIFGGNSFGACILNDLSESYLDHDSVNSITVATTTPTTAYATIPNPVVLNVTVSAKLNKTVKKVPT